MASSDQTLNKELNMAADILITIALVTGAVLIFAHLTRLARNAALQRTIRRAIDRDSPNLPDLVAHIGEEPKGTEAEEKAGLVLMALAVALALYAFIAAPNAEELRNMGGLAVFPGLVGAVLFGRALWTRRRGEGN